MLTDAQGVPLVVQTGPANQRDDTKLEDLLEAFPVLTDGDEQKTVHVQPKELLGDRGFAYLIALVLLFGIVSRLSPRGKGKPHGSGLGEQRYVVERTMSWWTHFRRINLCYEQRYVVERTSSFVKVVNRIGLAPLGGSRRLFLSSHLPLSGLFRVRPECHCPRTPWDITL